MEHSKECRCAECLKMLKDGEFIRVFNFVDAKTMSADDPRVLAATEIIPMEKAEADRDEAKRDEAKRVKALNQREAYLARQESAWKRGQ